MPAARETLLPAFVAGFAAGSLFFLALSVPSAGGLVFFPLLPLLLVGLSQGLRRCLFACCVASLVAFLFSGFLDRLFFLGFIVLPAGYLTWRALLFRGSEGGRQWYPMLGALTELTAIGAAFLMLMALIAVHHGGLKAYVPHGLAGAFKNADPDTAATIQLITGELSFVLLAFIAWCWLIIPYAFACLANVILASKHKALRLSLAIESRDLPIWLLPLLALSALVALVGQGGDRFNAQTVFLLLLLPYFLSGAAWVHLLSIRRQIFMRRLWITCFYVVLVTLRWPVLGVIAIGLYLQLSEILDRRKGMR